MPVNNVFYDTILFRFPQIFLFHMGIFSRIPDPGGGFQYKTMIYPSIGAIGALFVIFANFHYNTRLNSKVREELWEKP